MTTSFSAFHIFHTNSSEPEATSDVVTPNFILGIQLEVKLNIGVKIKELQP